jgi:RNA polymerase sigma-70 factor (ECF subfamily)
MSAALDLLRRRRARRADLTVEIDEQRQYATAGEGPEQAMEVSELTAQVAQAISTIPASRRPVVRMYLVGYPREEIARVLGWSEAKTRNLLYRGLADLRERLSAMGISWESET